MNQYCAIGSAEVLFARNFLILGNIREELKISDMQRKIRNINGLELSTLIPLRIWENCRKETCYARIRNFKNSTSFQELTLNFQGSKIYSLKKNVSRKDIK